MTTLEALKTLADMGVWERRAPDSYCLQPERHKGKLVRFPCDDPYCVANICAACLEELIWKDWKEGMTKEELAEIRLWIESEEVWEILTPDWRQLTLDLLAEMEKLQAEVKRLDDYIHCRGEKLRVKEEQSWHFMDLFFE